MQMYVKIVQIPLKLSIKGYNSLLLSSKWENDINHFIKFL